MITQSMLAQRSNELDPVTHGDLITSMGQLQRNARDLQESVMSIRMMPMEYVFSRFPRPVRDTASKLNKQIELTLMGSSTELDKSLIERIIDPLTHRCVTASTTALSCRKTAWQPENRQWAT